MKEKSPHILFVSHKYPPSIGGMQKQNFELIHYAESVCGTQKIVFNNNYPVFLFLISAVPRVWFKLIKNKRIQIVHANDGLMALFLTPLLLVKNLKLSATIHGLDIVFKSSPFQYWVKKYLTKFHLLIAVSEATKIECIKRGVSEDKVICIPNAFDPPTKSSIKKEFKEWIKSIVGNDAGHILTSVGRTVPRKGFSWFIKNVLLQIDQKCTYLIVGPELKNSSRLTFLEKLLPKWLFNKYCILNGIPLDYIELKKLEVNPKFAGKFLMLGKLSDSNLNQLYQYSDLFIMPNIHVEGDFEGFGLVALEAASRGSLCIASDTDGIPSAIKDNSNGYLIPEKDGNAWSKKINDLLASDHQQIARTFTNNILKENYTWAEMGKLYITAFSQIINKEA